MTARLKQALAGRTPAWLSQTSGIKDATIRKYLRGAQPTVVPAVKLSDALGVSLEWLLTGAGEMHSASGVGRPRAAGAALFSADEADWVFLPHYEFESAMAAMGNVVTRTYPVPRHLLNQQLGTARNLWVTDMPTDELPSVAAKGEPIICRNALMLDPGKAYILGLHGNLIVRRLTVRGFATDNELDPALSLEEAQLQGVFPVGEILARFGLSPVQSRFG